MSVRTLLLYALFLKKSIAFGKLAEKIIQSKKIYSRRYTTDCLSAIFNQYADKNTIGIDDLEEYLTELGTDEENLMQNLFFQNETHYYN